MNWELLVNGLNVVEVCLGIGVSISLVLVVHRLCYGKGS